jgi:biopolymer transport protein ExbB/TolQ
MTRMYRIASRIRLGIALGLWIPLMAFADAAPQRIHINGINRVVHKNWLRVPKSADYTVYWDLYQISPSGWNLVDPSVMDSFRVTCQAGSDSRMVEIRGNYATFTKCHAGRKYLFTIVGLQGQKAVAVSDTASALTGKPLTQGQTGRFSANGPEPRTKWHHWFPLNGRIPLALMGVGQVFDLSSLLGQICFHLIWILFLVGLFIWLFYCVPNLKLSKIFPMTDEKIFFKGYNEIYQKRESPEFRKVLEDWRELMIKTGQNVRNELKQGEQINMQDLSGANVRFWRDYGNRTVRDLVKRITDRRLDRFPAVRVVKAGLSNHENGGFRWLEVSKEVERAIENQASSELELLRRETMYEQLWNLATIEPLLGLFGTVTGISAAFGLLSSLPEDTTQITLINKLSSGIYEALWTTIEGLFVGIVFSLGYYYYQRKLDWVYSKWEEFYVYVAEKL